MKEIVYLEELQGRPYEKTENQDPITPAGEVVEPQKMADERVGSKDVQGEAYERSRTESQEQTASISDLPEPPEKLEQYCGLGELHQGADEQCESQHPVAPDSEVVEPELTGRKAGQEADELPGNRDAQEETDERTKSQAQIAHDSETAEPRAMHAEGHDETARRSPIASVSAAAELLAEAHTESRVLRNSIDSGGDGPALLKEVGEQTQSREEIVPFI